jgi:predicted amidohydrolase
MIIAAAQTKPFENNTTKNIDCHLQLIKLAAQQGVELIVFPEMSLTGYERELACELAFTEQDARLEVFKRMSALHKMIIVVGAPIHINSQLYIGSFIFSPDNTTSIYTKQFLHEGEEFYFSSNSSYNPLIQVADEKISIAICADIAHPEHPANASNHKTTIYLASIFYTPNGISEAYMQLSEYAAKYKMNVLMANYSGPSYHMESAGKSACWDKKGNLIGNLNSHSEGLLIARYDDEKWTSSVIEVPVSIE